MDSRSTFLHHLAGAMEGRIRRREAELWLCPSLESGLPHRKIRAAQIGIRREARKGDKSPQPGCREKLLSVEGGVPVP